MARPSGLDWYPLGVDADPVPGDPQQIREQAAQLLEAAQQLDAQAGRLHRIVASSDNLGKTPDAIRAAASQVAGELTEVATRYQRVGSALNGWAPDLDEAQQLSVRALDQAEAPFTKLRQAGIVLSPGMGWSSQPSTPALRQAATELEQARALLIRATSLRDDRGDYWAGVINAACDDALKDSWWQAFTSWVSQHAGWLKDACTILEIIATALAVLALIFSGVGWIVVLGLVVTGLAVTGRVLLAITGQGSWLDVAVDAASLFTFGFGSFVTARLGDAVEGMVKLARGMEAEKVAWIMERFAAVAGDEAAQRVLAKILDNAVPVIKDPEDLTLAIRVSGLWDRLTGAGDREVVNLMKTLANLSKKYEDIEEIQELAARAEKAGTTLKWNFRLSNAIGLGSQVAGGFEWDHGDGAPEVQVKIPGASRAYADAQYAMTTHGGLTEEQADVFADISTVALPTVGLPLQAFRLAWSRF